MNFPLEGVRVVEMGQLIAVPHAVKMLADMGAQVIRVESHARLEGYRASAFYDNDPGEAYWNRGANFYEQNRKQAGSHARLVEARRAGHATRSDRGQRRVHRELHSQGDAQLQAGVRRSARAEARRGIRVLDRLRLHRAVVRIRRDRADHRGGVGTVPLHRIRGWTAGACRDALHRLYRRRTHRVRDSRGAGAPGAHRQGPVRRRVPGPGRPAPQRPRR